MLIQRPMRAKKHIIKDYGNLVNGSIKGIQRGFVFEKLVNEILEIENLNPSYSYKAAGEQIDGMFEFRNRYFHFECKWEDKAISVSSIYQLQGKLDGKLDGSLGVFISMSNFSTDAPKALEKGKSINIILFTKEDMDFIFSNKHYFNELLDVKLRYAALYGSTLYEYISHLQMQKLNKAK